MDTHVAHNITFENITTLRMIARHTVRRICNLAGPDRSGGYIYLSDPVGNTRMHECVGDPPKDKIARYHDFSYEKARRLWVHVTHKTSWQSRNERLNQYGGAIRLPSGFILSFSGFPELFDEAYCVGLARRMSWLNAKEGNDLLTLSRNTTSLRIIMDVLVDPVPA